MSVGGHSRWDLVEGLRARAHELWNDPANYTYQHIARILNEEFRSKAPAVYLGITKGIVAKFFFDNGQKRYSNATGGRPKAERKVDVRTARKKHDGGPAKQRAAKMAEAKARAERKAAKAVELEDVEREEVAPGSGQWPRKVFDLALWGKPTIGLGALGLEMCKWPFEDAETGVHSYCGAPRAIIVYCVHHGSLAYRVAPSEERNAKGGRGGYEDAERAADQKLAQVSDDTGEPQVNGEHDPERPPGIVGEAGDAGDTIDHDAVLEGVDDGDVS